MTILIKIKFEKKNLLRVIYRKSLVDKIDMIPDLNKSIFIILVRKIINNIIYFSVTSYLSIVH